MVAASDTFTRGNSTTTLGTTETGGLTWGVAAAAGITNWGVDTGQAYPVGTTPTNHWATVDTGESDGTVEVTVSGATAGAIFRYTSGANFLMVSSAPTGIGAPFTRLLRIQSNVVTVLAVTLAAVSGDTVKAHFEGDQITWFRNGTQIGTAITSSFNQTATKHGMFASATTARLDNWSFTPPVVPTWPLRVVSEAGDVYRIGPTANPDGGLLRIVSADGRVWKQGAAGPGSQEVPADSFSVLDVEDGARWADDGPSSLHDVDGSKVYWLGSIGGAGVGDQWVEAQFGPITPAGATCTGIVVSQSIVTGAGSGKTDLCLADGTVINTNTSTAGNASTFNATHIADIIANGALVRRYGTDAALFASAAFELDRVELGLFFDDIPARPLRYVSSDGTVEVTLPMVLDS